MVQIKRSIFYAAVIILLLLFVLEALSAKTVSPATAMPLLAGRVIVIDPGHGRIDHGAIGVSGVREDYLNLQVSMLVRDKLKQAGAVVVLTRESGKVDYSGDAGTRKRRDMDNRAKLITAMKPSAVISIHMNKYPNKKYYGPQTYYSHGNVQGQKLANSIQKELLANLSSYKQFRIVEGNLFILHVVDAPSALVECGFLSNAGDEKRLTQRDYQDKIAACICRGICGYFGAKYN